jgi:hypothetical protein
VEVPVPVTVCTCRGHECKDVNAPLTVVERRALNTMASARLAVLRDSRAKAQAKYLRERVDQEIAVLESGLLKLGI